MLLNGTENDLTETMPLVGKGLHPARQMSFLLVDFIVHSQTEKMGMFSASLVSCGTSRYLKLVGGNDSLVYQPLIQRVEANELQDWSVTQICVFRCCRALLSLGLTWKWKTPCL